MDCIMNVLHLVRTFLPISENWVYNQIIFNRSCAASILCQFRDNETLFPHDAVYPTHAHRTRWATCDMLLARLRDRYRVRPAYRIIRQVKPDLIHGHFAFESWRNLAAVRRSGAPLVTTFYGVDISVLPKRASWRKRYAVLFEFGAAFLVEGPFMADQLAGLGCPSEKIHCIPIGVDIGAIRAVPDGRNDSAVRVVFVGLGREKKGALHAAESFIAVAKRLPSLRLDLIGDGIYAAPIRDRIGAAGLLDRCTFHGMVQVARYIEILRSADLLLAPSFTAANGDSEGGAPVTVIEAQAAGIPVVGTLHCDIPMVVKHGETGLLCPERDTVSLTKNLECLAMDYNMRRRFGEAASKRAELNHDIKKQVEKITEVYKKVQLSVER
jgi:colanic acid/amylovoran biosynthesis glycosyltransferase